jgi:hypothetical protein
MNIRERQFDRRNNFINHGLYEHFG